MADQIQSKRKIEILVGILFLTATISFFTGDSIITTILDKTDYLSIAANSTDQIIFAALMEFTDGLAIFCIAVLLYPILQMEDEMLSLGYLGTRVVEFAIILVYLLSALLLITVGTESVGSTNPAHYQTLGEMIRSTRFWGLMLIYLLNGVAGTFLCYGLWKLKIIPRTLSGLGLLGYPVLFIMTILAMFGVVNIVDGIGMLALVPGGLFELVLPFWLFIKGFDLDDEVAL